MAKQDGVSEAVGGQVDLVTAMRFWTGVWHPCCLCCQRFSSRAPWDDDKKCFTNANSPAWSALVFSVRACRGTTTVCWVQFCCIL